MLKTFWRGSVSTIMMCVHYRGDIMSTMGDILSTVGRYHDKCGNVMSNVGDIFSTVGDFQYHGETS